MTKTELNRQRQPTRSQMEAEKILVENLREALNASQRYIILTITASISLFLLQLVLISQGDSNTPIELKGLPVATDPRVVRMLLLGVLFILPFMARSAIIRAKDIAMKITDEEVRGAALTYPSLATDEDSTLRVGSALVSMFLIAFSQFFWVASQIEVNWWNFLWGTIILEVPFLYLAKVLQNPINSPSQAEVDPNGAKSEKGAIEGTQTRSPQRSRGASRSRQRPE